MPLLDSDSEGSLVKANPPGRSFRLCLVGVLLGIIVSGILTGGGSIFALMISVGRGNGIVGAIFALLAAVSILLTLMLTGLWRHRIRSWVIILICATLMSVAFATYIWNYIPCRDCATHAGGLERIGRFSLSHHLSFAGFNIASSSG